MFLACRNREAEGIQKDVAWLSEAIKQDTSKRVDVSPPPPYVDEFCAAVTQFQFLQQKLLDKSRLIVTDAKRQSHVQQYIEEEEQAASSSSASASMLFRSPEFQQQQKY